ncbi:hypothetical protein C5S29_07795 [ANME-1 cluster archaeon GoMg3.2]|nr:hypothetical protein [ANME-1 cluster archaeon GoMg3.2]
MKTIETRQKRQYETCGMKDLHSIVIATTDPALETFTPAFKDRIGKTMVLSSIVRGDLVEIIRKRASDNNPFTSEAMIILAERYNSPRRLFGRLCRSMHLFWKLLAVSDQRSMG